MAEPAYIPPEGTERRIGEPVTPPQGAPLRPETGAVPVEGVDRPLENQPLTQYDVRAWQGLWVFDIDGEPVGKVSDVLVDANRRPEWMVVSFGAFLHEDRLVPVFDLEERPDGLVVTYSKDMVRGAPIVGVANMSDEDEQKVMSYWCTTREAASPRACTFLGR